MREKDKDLVQSITAFTVGPAKAVDTLRTALAMGADTGIHVKVPDNATVEPLAVAEAIKKVVEREGDKKIDLVILGKQAIDDDSGATGGMLAGLLNWPQASFASKLDVSADGAAKVTREIDGGLEELKTKLPLIVTTDLRLNGESALFAAVSGFAGGSSPFGFFARTDSGMTTTSAIVFSAAMSSCEEHS